MKRKDSNEKTEKQREAMKKKESNDKKEKQ